MPKQNQADGAGTTNHFPAQPDGREPVTASSCPGLADFTWRVVIVLLLVAVALLFWRGLHVLLLTFTGVLLAVFLSALSDWLSRRTGIAHGWALAAVVVGLLLLTGCLGWLFSNRLAVQIAELSAQLPRSLGKIREYFEAHSWGQFLLERAPRMAESLAESGDFSRVTGFVSGVASFIVAAVVILFVGIFGAAEPTLYRKGLLHLIPPRNRPRVAQTLDAVAFSLRGWIVGQICLMVLLAATTTAGLWLLGIPMALTLGLMAGIFELVPYIGAWLSAVPAALVALLLGPWYLVMTLALYLALHILEGYLLVPLIQRRAVHLPPALTLVSQVLLGELLGPLGLFVAAPLTVVVVVFLKLLYVEDALGDNSVEVPGVASGQNSTTGTAHFHTSEV